MVIRPARNEIQPRRGGRAGGGGRAGEVGGGRIGLPVAAHQAAAFRPRRAQARGEGAHHWPSGLAQELPPLDAGFLYEVTEGVSEFDPRAAAAAASCPAMCRWRRTTRPACSPPGCASPCRCRKSGQGRRCWCCTRAKPLPRFAVPTQALDLRTASADLVAAYAIFRRYLFDYRVDLATPLWMLIDSASRVRKIYAECARPRPPPGGSARRGRARARRARAAVRRRLPRQPARDYFKIGGAMMMAGYGEQALPYLEEASRRSPDNARDAAGHRPHPPGGEPAGAGARGARARHHARPGLPEAWNDLGGVEAAAGNPREALRASTSGRWRSGPTCPTRW
jgi:hypothetical protein